MMMNFVLFISLLIHSFIHFCSTSSISGRRQTQRNKSRKCSLLSRHWKKDSEVELSVQEGEDRTCIWRVCLKCSAAGSGKWGPKILVRLLRGRLFITSRTRMYEGSLIWKYSFHGYYQVKMQLYKIRMGSKSKPQCFHKRKRPSKTGQGHVRRKQSRNAWSLLNETRKDSSLELPERARPCHKLDIKLLTFRIVQ